MTLEPRQSKVRWTCEQHPGKAWPHDDCAGPGEIVFPAHVHAYDERGFCVVCRMTADEVTRAMTEAEKAVHWFTRAYEIAQERDRHKAQAARLRGELLAIASGHPDPQGTARRLLESGR